MKKILFISHDALRTGAPIFLWNFLQWFGKNTSIPFRILLKNGGELEPEFRSLAPVSIFNKREVSGTGPVHSRLHAIDKRLHLGALKKELSRDNIGLIYSNTATNGEVLEFLSDLRCPVITQVHELEYWIHRTGPANMDLVRKYTDRYIAVSNAVKENLIRNHGIDESRIDTVHGFIPMPTVKRPECGKDLRTSLNIPGDGLIVGSSGMDTWRKGKDLFIQLAVNVVREFRDNPVHFVWIGGHGSEREAYEIKHDLRHAGIEGNVHFVSHVVNPLDYYHDFDIFAMISREDPFPLVNLEVAAMGKPIVCFAGAGGTPEFVGHDAGFVVPYLDLGAMADRIVDLAKDAGLRKTMGSKGSKKVRENHDITVGAGKISGIIERFM